MQKPSVNVHQISYTACLTCIFQRQLFIAVSQSKVCQKQCRTIRHHILLYNLTVFWVGSQGSSWGVVARLIVGVRAINEWAARPNITVQSESATIFCRTIRLYAESPVKADCWCPTVSVQLMNGQQGRATCQCQHPGHRPPFSVAQLNCMQSRQWRLIVGVCAIDEWAARPSNLSVSPPWPARHLTCGPHSF